MYKNTNKKEILKKYLALRQILDKRIKELEVLHSKHLLCNKGCSDCCKVDKTVNSIEAEIVKQSLLKLPNKAILKIKTNYSKEICTFLHNDDCLIYENRPFICRSHGLPILYYLEEQAGIDFCPKNFKEFSIDNGFLENEILDMIRFNNELIQLDQLFCKTCLNENWIPTKRINLFELL